MYVCVYIYNSRYHNYFSLKKHKYFCFDKCQSVFDKTLNSKGQGFPLLGLKYLPQCLTQNRRFKY